MTDLKDSLEALGVEIEHHFAPDVYCKTSRIKAGACLTKHTHTYDHLSVLVSGKAIVEVDGEQYLREGYCCMTVEANKEHKVTALTDIIWLCIHATDDTDPNTVDVSLMSKVVHG